jgi:uncharacterized protein YggE
MQQPSCIMKSGRGWLERGEVSMSARITALAAIALLAATVPAAAQLKVERSITVAGEGSVAAAPDMALVRAGVTTQGKTAKAASEANNVAMAKVLTALDAAGIAAKDVQTAHFAIYPQRDYPQRDSRQNDGRITGFQASNQVSVRVHAVDKVADVLDRIIAAGANEISGIQFTVAKPSKLLDDARIAAVEDARRKAEVLAKAAGVRLGRATVIAEEGAAPPRPMVMRAAQAASTPIAVGEQTLRIAVTVTYELLH